jgi:hypothetical protein
MPVCTMGVLVGGGRHPPDGGQQSGHPVIRHHGVEQGQVLRPRAEAGEGRTAAAPTAGPGGRRSSPRRMSWVEKGRPARGPVRRHAEAEQRHEAV